MGYDVKNQIAIVTGSARGFGKEFAVRLLERGAKVCISDVDENEGEQTKKEFNERYGAEKVTFLKCDVTQESDWQAIWAHTEDTFGGKVQILVNNAGVNPVRGWKICMDIMIYGVMMGSYIARDKMGVTKGGKGGRVINIASMAGLVPGLGRFDDLGYTVSKFGAVSFTRSYAACSSPKPWEDDQIKAYALCPWFADTDLVKETIEIKKLEKKVKYRALTIQDVGNAFDETLEADENGGVFLVFPDAPIIKFPELNKIFILPIIAYAKLVGFCRPQWKRVNGMYGIPLFFLIIFFIFYLLFWFIF